MAQATLETPQKVYELDGLRYIANKLTMVSIFPIECVAYRNYGPQMHGAVNKKFTLPAAKKGSYSKLELYDCFERSMDRDSMEFVGKPVFKPSPVPVGQIAACLFREWVTNRLGCSTGQRPGIMIITGDEPTKEELASMVPQQEAYARVLYHDANQQAEKHNWRDITSLHRELSKWAGLKARWIEDEAAAYQETKKCSACRKDIPADASVCFICNRDQKAA